MKIRNFISGASFTQEDLLKLHDVLGKIEAFTAGVDAEEFDFCLHINNYWQAEKPAKEENEA